VNTFRRLDGWAGARRWRDWLQRFYFEPTRPEGLALCRVWIYGYLFVSCLRRDYSQWGEATPELWQPIWLFAWLPGPPAAEALAALQVGFLFALAMCCTGFCFRGAAIAAFVLSLAVYGLPNCFGKVNHAQTLSVFALAVFALSHAGRVWSVDAWFARRRCVQPAPALSAEYQWPVRLLQALMATVFMAAGIAKLRESGLAWIYSDNMQNTLLEGYYIGRDLPTNLGLAVAQFPLLCQVLAGTSILLELTAPLALWSRPYRRFVIPGLFAMQLGIYLTMAIGFWQFLALYVVWIEWNELAALVSRAAGNPRSGTEELRPAQRLAA
jgi:hypothetical protein